MKRRISGFLVERQQPQWAVLIVCFLFIGFMGNSAWASLDAEILYARGSQEYLSGKYDEALKTLSQGAIIDSQHAGIQLAIGLCHLNLKEYQKAYWAFRTALYINPQITRGQLYLGISHYFLNEYKKARACFLEARKQEPEDGLAAYYLGLCELQLNNPRKALQELQEGSRLSPDLAQFFQPHEQQSLIPTDVRIKKIRQEFLFGAHYDSNVELHTRPYYLSKGRKNPKYTDWAGVMTSKTEYYPIIRPNFNLGFRLNVYNNSHLYLESWNFANGRAEALMNWQLGPILLQPSYQFDYTLYGGQEYSTMYNYCLTVDWPETDWLRGELFYRSRNKQFHYGRGLQYIQHGWDHQVEFSQGLSLAGWGVVRLGVFFNRDLARGEFWASHTLGTSVNGVFFLPWKVTGWLSFEYGRKIFDNFDEWSRRRQENDIFLGQLLLKRPITQDVAMWLGYGFANTRANIPEWQFSRSIVQMMVTWNLF